jgi:hypothetical protein
MKSSTINGSYSDFLEGYNHYQDKIFTFISSHINEFPSVKMGVDPISGEGGTPVTRKPLETYPAQDSIVTKSGRVVIRYVPGESTIFVSEMSDAAKSNTRNERIVFINGVCVVPGYEKYKLEFMFSSNRNLDNPTRKAAYTIDLGYRLFDRSAKYKEVIDSGLSMEEAKTWCYKNPSSEILQYAKVLLGIEAIVGVDVNEVRVKMFNVASRDPKKFMDDKDSPTVKRKGYILTAIDRGIIVNNSQRGQVSWSNNPSQALSTAPIGVNSVDHFLNITLSSEGQHIFAEILRQLEPANISPPIVNIPLEIVSETIKIVPNTTNNFDLPTKEEAQKLVEELFKAEILFPAGTAWIKHKDGVQKWRGKDGLVMSLTIKPDLSVSLRKDLANSKILAE